MGKCNILFLWLFLTCGKLGRFPNLFSKNFPKNFFQKFSKNDYSFSKNFPNRICWPDQLIFFQVRSSHIWNHVISRFSELVQVTLDQRVLLQILCSKVQSISAFQILFVGGHVVRAKPSAEAIKSIEIWRNHGFWAKSWLLKGTYGLLGAHLCLGVHWNCQEWKDGWI